MSYNIACVNVIQDFNNIHGSEYEHLTDKINYSRIITVVAIQTVMQYLDNLIYFIKFEQPVYNILLKRKCIYAEIL